MSAFDQKTLDQGAKKLREAARELERGEVASAGRIVLAALPPILGETKRIYGPTIWSLLRSRIDAALK